MANTVKSEIEEQDQTRDLGDRWQAWYRRRPWISSIVTILLLLLAAFLLAFIIALFLWALRPNDAPSWTGFGSADLPLYTGISPYKTLWDWLGLLIIPMFLGLIAAVISRAQQNREMRQHEAEQVLADEARQNDWLIEKDRQEQDRIDHYFVQMSQLLLEYDLRASSPDDEIRYIARASTLNVLRSINATRKSMLLLFLYEAHLINNPDPIINLEGADLQQVELESADLREAYLAQTDMSDAKLDRAILAGSDLTAVNLIGAELRHANLKQALLAGAYLSGTHLREANLHHADLSGVLLNDASVIEANLHQANLTQANLVGADLSQARLQGANLSEAKCQPSKADAADNESLIVTGATYDNKTIWPSDYDPAAHGAQKVES